METFYKVYCNTLTGITIANGDFESNIITNVQSRTISGQLLFLLLGISYKN